MEDETTGLTIDVQAILAEDDTHEDVVSIEIVNRFGMSLHLLTLTEAEDLRRQLRTAVEALKRQVAARKSDPLQ